MITIYRPEGKYVPRKTELAKELYLEPKYDGRWVRVTTEEGPPRVESHNVSVDTGSIIVLPIGAPWSLPKKSVVECELLWPGHPAAEVSHALANGLTDELCFKPFVIPRWNGRDLTRETYLTGRTLAAGRGVPLPPFIRVDHRITVDEILAQHRLLWPETEGVVVKQYWYANWWKVKPVETIDARVRGYTVGTAGKWKGKPNAIFLSSVTGHDLGRCGIFPDEARAQIPAHVGKIVEVYYDCLTATGKLRFPRFKCWREDKS